jgi:hypothetical protein
MSETPLKKMLLVVPEFVDVRMRARLVRDVLVPLQRASSRRLSAWLRDTDVALCGTDEQVDAAANEVQLFWEMNRPLPMHTDTVEVRLVLRRHEIGRLITQCLRPLEQRNRATRARARWYEDCDHRGVGRVEVSSTDGNTTALMADTVEIFIRDLQH